MTTSTTEHPGSVPLHPSPILFSNERQSSSDGGDAVSPSSPQGEPKDTEPNVRRSGLPSPPLTRIGSKDSIRARDTDVVDTTEQDTVLDIGSPFVVHPPADDHSLDNILDDTVVEADISQARKMPEDSPMSTIKRSNRYIDAKPPSPQPWDLIPPPEMNGKKAYEPHSPTSRFNTLKSASTRPLKPKSSYYFGPPPSDSAFGSPPVGQIGVHHPREIVRIERDYSGGELIQFSPIYPLELEGRLSATQFLETLNSINELLISAHSTRHSFIDNTLALLTLQISRWFFKSHYIKSMEALEALIDYLNEEVFNPAGLNMLWPRKVAFLFLEIEYY